MKKSYNIKISKYFSKTDDNTVLELTISKELSDLLTKFACIDESGRKTTSWTKSFSNEDTEDSNEYIERYLIKSVLKNSVRWTQVFDLLFTKDIIEHQTIKVPLVSSRMFTDVQNTVQEIKELITSMEKISTDKEINITMKVE